MPLIDPVLFLICVAGTASFSLLAGAYIGRENERIRARIAKAAEPESAAKPDLSIRQFGGCLCDGNEELGFRLSDDTAYIEARGIRPEPFIGPNGFEFTLGSREVPAYHGPNEGMVPDLRVLLNGVLVADGFTAGRSPASWTIDGDLLNRSRKDEARMDLVAYDSHLRALVAVAEDEVLVRMGEPPRRAMT